MSAEVTVTLGYWNCRGLGEVARMLLEYSGAKYKFVSPKAGPAPYFEKKEWMERKHDLLADFDFPNLPYYSDGLQGGIRLTQHVAIYEHLGRKFGLVPGPADETEWTNLDLFREQAKELIPVTTTYLYSPQDRAKGIEPTPEVMKAKKNNFITSARNIIASIDRKYGKCGGPWMVGKRLTYVDFVVYESVDQVRSVLSKKDEDEVFAGADHIANFMTKFEAIPKISKYLAARRKYPVYSERAFVGTTGKPTD